VDGLGENSLGFFFGGIHVYLNTTFAPLRLCVKLISQQKIRQGTDSVSIIYANPAGMSRGKWGLEVGKAKALFPLSLIISIDIRP
jgi:hypothetical protein